jgi:hypothetical protein
MWRDYDNDCEILFDEEVRDKRRTASGARHNSGRRGGGTKGITGHMTMPSDLLKYSDKKAYKEYVKGSVIKLSNNYENIDNLPSLAELKVMEQEMAHNIVKVAKNLHTNKELIQYWHISSGSLYSGVFDKYNVLYPKSSKDNVVETDMYEDIELVPSMEALDKMDFEEAHNIITSVKNQHKVKPIQEHWGIKGYAYYNYLDKYKIMYIHHNSTRDAEKEKAAKKDLLIEEQQKILEENMPVKEEQKVEDFEIVNSINELQKENTILKYKLVESESQEFNLKYVKNNVSGEELQKRVMDYVGITYPESHYEIKLMIRELSHGK